MSKEHRKPTWEETGNLRGNHKVKSRDKGVPNTGIIEDEAVFNHRMGAVRVTAAGQQARANQYLDPCSGNVMDHRFWFAQVYTYVTQGEIEEIESSNYYYPSYVAECVRYFDQIYEDNINAWDDGGQVEEHWREAFQNAADTNEINWHDVLFGVAGGALTALGGIGGMVNGVI